MSADLLERIERDLCKVGEELWNIDGPDDVLDEVLKKISLLKVQLEIQKSLQATANLLRRQPSDKALPKQQATKVKHFIRFVFRKESRGEGRHRQLRNLDCDALKFCGLSYTTEEIVKLGDAEFEILQNRIAEFTHYRNLSHLLYRPDVDKAVDAKLEDPEDDESFDKFMQSHTARRLSTRKRKYDAIASPNKAAGASTTEETNTESVKYGDVFALNIEDARYALSCGQDVTEIFVTNPKTSNKIGDKSSFLTAWISEGLGELLSKRGQPVNY